MTNADIINYEVALKERIFELLSKLTEIRIAPYIIYASQADLTASASTPLSENTLKLPGTGGSILRAIEWFSNSARGSFWGTINHNERRKENIVVQNIADNEPLSRLNVLAAVFFGQLSSRWDAPCEYVVDPAAGFRTTITDDGITASQDVFLSLHADIWEGFARSDLEEASNLGLLHPNTSKAITAIMSESPNRQCGPAEWAYRKVRAEIISKIHYARRVPYIVSSNNANIAASLATSMSDDDFRLPGLGAYLAKSIRFFFDVASRDETAPGGVTFYITNNILDRVDIHIADIGRAQYQLTSNLTPAGLIAQWDTAEWKLPKPYVTNPNGTFRFTLMERMGVATTDCYAAIHGYYVRGLSVPDALKAVALGLLE